MAEEGFDRTGALNEAVGEEALIPTRDNGDGTYTILEETEPNQIIIDKKSKTVTISLEMALALEDWMAGGVYNDLVAEFQDFMGEFAGK